MAGKQRGAISAVPYLLPLVALLSGATIVRSQTALTLAEAIRQAQSGPAAQVADFRVDEVRGGVRQAGLAPNPRLYLQSEDLRPWDDNFSFVNQTEDYGYFGQTLELGGKRGKRVSFGQARLAEAEATRALQLRQLAARVAEAYWNAVSLGQIAELLHQDLRIVDEVVEYHQKRVDAGAMRGVDLLRVQIERDRLAISLEASQRDAAQAKLELFRQMGRPPAEVILTEKLEDAGKLRLDEATSSLDQRPDVQVARAAVVAAEADLKLQHANAVPDPDLLAGYKRNSSDNTAFAGVQIPLPLRNKNQGEIERASAGLARARTALALLQTQISVELEQARRSFESQQRIVTQTLPEMRARAQQNLQIESEAYRIGGTDLLRFLDAERTEFDVEVMTVRTLAQLQLSSIQLRLAYGVQP